MQVEHERGLRSFLAQLDTLGRVLHDLPEADFWAATWCQGWCVADVVMHLHLGLQEMLLGAVNPTSAAVDTDAATYWAGSVAAEPDGHAEHHQRHFVRQLSAAYGQPRRQLRQIDLTAAGLSRAVRALPDGRVFFQDRVLRTGDFFATWAVELAVHQLDLGRELDLPEPDTSALTLARQTIENLVGEACPTSWADDRVVLLGTGRVHPSAAERTSAPDLTRQLPVLG